MCWYYSNVFASALKCVYLCLYVGMSVVVWLCIVCTVCMFGLDVECVLLVFPCCVVLESLRQRVSLCLFSSVVLRERTAQVSVYPGGPQIVFELSFCRPE